MIRKRWLIYLTVALALLLAAAAALLLTSRKFDPPLSDSARFVCGDTASHKTNLRG